MGVGQVDLAVDADQAERALLLSLDTREVTHESLPFPFEIRRCIRTTVPSGRPRGDEHDEQGGRRGPRCWNRQAAHPSNGITRNMNCRSVPIAVRDTKVIRTKSTVASTCPQRALLGRCRGSTKLRTNGVTTRTPMASPAPHTAHHLGSS